MSNHSETDTHKPWVLVRSNNARGQDILYVTAAVTVVDWFDGTPALQIDGGWSVVRYEIGAIVGVASDPATAVRIRRVVGAITIPMHCILETHQASRAWEEVTSERG